MFGCVCELELKYCFVIQIDWPAHREINRLATIDGNTTFPITEDFQHYLKKFLWINFYYAFFYVFTFLICNIFLVYKIVGLVGECGCHGRNFSCCLVGG